jgi:hypothetical protein
MSSVTFTLPSVMPEGQTISFIPVVICKNCRFWENRTDLPRPMYQRCFRLGTSEASDLSVRQAYADDKMFTTENFGCTEFKARQ